MKSILLSTLALTIVLFFTTTTRAQETKQNNYVVLTKKISQLQPILLTAENLKKEDGNAFGDFQVIICGKTVNQLSNKELIDGFIEKAKAINVKIVVCGLSLKKFKIDKSVVPKPIEIVKNGLLYNFRLQKKGYLSIEL
jgi:intracellular sulfur oxidation DsrE/DsrF family protein